MFMYDIRIFIESNGVIYGAWENCEELLNNLKDWIVASKIESFFDEAVKSGAIKTKLSLLASQL